ncbi:hypothetical protein BKA62DRAFT_676861 [Auriculariales sp. MPI-PUGE-AT-0066]|nr:hypothetical protein BKA62DRAFT_676861 [Auriculariales sp. MPI-PUGE-AT-0066]
MALPIVERLIPTGQPFAPTTRSLVTTVSVDFEVSRSVLISRPAGAIGLNESPYMLLMNRSGVASPGENLTWPFATVFWLVFASSRATASTAHLVHILSMRVVFTHPAPPAATRVLEETRQRVNIEDLTLFVLGPPESSLPPDPDHTISVRKLPAPTTTGVYIVRPDVQARYLRKNRHVYYTKHVIGRRIDLPPVAAGPIVSHPSQASRIVSTLGNIYIQSADGQAQVWVLSGNVSNPVWQLVHDPVVGISLQEVGVQHPHEALRDYVLHKQSAHDIYTWIMRSSAHTIDQKTKHS